MLMYLMCCKLQSNGAESKSKTCVNKQERMVDKCSRHKTNNYYLTEKTCNRIQSRAHKQETEEITTVCVSKQKNVPFTIFTHCKTYCAVGMCTLSAYFRRNI